MKRDPRLYLDDILKSIMLLEKYLDGISKEQFYLSEEKQDVAARRIEIIGEATKRLSDDFKRQHTDIPWKTMAGMRDILIHQYDNIDLDVIWEAATRHIPPLKTQIQELLKEYSSD
ncbi:MAG: DUF86 domain-containing protein [Candidatus Levybacteria bacterium]|nr:DUF86 domain-containing protein [Candidatus Levybacteria bacterium]